MERRVLFEVLFTRLRAEGFALGYDHQLRLYQMLERVDCRPEDVREVLCPLFATSPWQQKRFREVFDESYPQFAATANAAPRRPWWWMGLTALLVSTFLALALWFGWRIWETQALKPQMSELPSKGPDPDDGRQTLSYRSQLIEFDALEGSEPPRRDWWPVLSPLGIWLAWLWWSWRKRPAKVEKGAMRPPPHYWPLRVERAGEKIYAHADVAALSRLLRRRVAGQVTVLDIRATIGATIRAGGYTRIQRRALAKAPEYLVLIERRALNDHFAHLIDELCELLRREGVFLERFFFEGDARALVDDAGRAWRLDEIAGRFGGHRVLVFADSLTFLHPVTGRLETWARGVWPQWTEKAALLTDRPNTANREELRRAGFVLGPASMAGVRDVAGFWNRGGGEEGLAPPAFAPLERPLDKDSDWVRACAIYPELNWNLSLHLGDGAMDEAAVSRLARNEWFRGGVMPPPARERLRRALPEEQRGVVAGKLRALLQAHPAPPEGSAARAAWDAQLRLFDGTRGARHEEAKEAIEDVTLLRFLEDGEEPEAGLGRRISAHPLAVRVATGLVAVAFAVGLYFQMAPRVERIESVRIVAEGGGAAGSVQLEVNGVGHDPSRNLPDDARSVVVKTVRPHWTRSWRREGKVLRVNVGRGRPVDLPFRLESRTSGLVFRESGERYGIDVDFAGQVSSVRMDGYGSAELPLNGRKLDWVEETEDGLRLTVRLRRPGVVRWSLTPAKANESAGFPRDCCATTIARPALEAVYELTSDKAIVAPGEEVRFRWRPAAGRGELRLEYGGRRIALKPAMSSVTLRPAETQTYRIVEFGNVLSNEVVVTVTGRAPEAPVISYFRQSEGSLRNPGVIQLEWQVTNYSGEVEIRGGAGPVVKGKAAGFARVPVPMGRTTYTLRAGTAQQQLVLEGAGVSRITSFEVSPRTLSGGGMVTVAWQVERRGRDKVYLLVEPRQRPQGYSDPEPEEVSTQGRRIIAATVTTQITIYTEDDNGNKTAQRSERVIGREADMRGTILLRQVKCPSRLPAELQKSVLRLRLEEGRPVEIPLAECEKAGKQTYALGDGGPLMRIRIEIDARSREELSVANLWSDTGEPRTIPYSIQIDKSVYVFELTWQARFSAPAMAK